MHHVVKKMIPEVLTEVGLTKGIELSLH